MGILVMWISDSEDIMHVRGTVDIWTLEGSMDKKPRLGQVEVCLSSLSL